MAFQTELALINEFIENFNVDEFSSTIDFVVHENPTDADLSRAKRIKEKLGRKHRMAEAFNHSLELDFDFDSDAKVCITQEEIDALLDSV